MLLYKPMQYEENKINNRFNESLLDSDFEEDIQIENIQAEDEQEVDPTLKFSQKLFSDNKMSVINADNRQKDKKQDQDQDNYDLEFKDTEIESIDNILN